MLACRNCTGLLSLDARDLFHPNAESIGHASVALCVSVHADASFKVYRTLPQRGHTAITGNAAFVRAGRWPRSQQVQISNMCLMPEL